MSSDLLAWVDIETTGLDIDNDVVLEFAVLITDGALNEIITGPDLLIRPPDGALDQMNEFVRAMHQKSGLLSLLHSDRVLGMFDAEAIIYDFLTGVSEDGTIPMAGASIGSLDRPMLRKHMPRVHDWFNYRSVDVSSFKEALCRWAPWVVSSRPTEEKEHRAIADIRESLRELRHYKGWIQRGTDSHTFM